MKGKLLLGLALTSMISTSFALEIKNGRLINHKEWTTGVSLTDSLNASSKKGNYEKFKADLKAKNITLSDSSTLSYAAIGAAEGVTGKRTEINGVQFAFLMNNTDGVQQFLISNNICAITGEKTTECMFYTDEVQLDAHGWAWDLQEATIDPRFNRYGKYPTFASSYILTMTDEGMYTLTTGAASEGYVNIAKK